MYYFISTKCCLSIINVTESEVIRVGLVTGDIKWNERNVLTCKPVIVDFIQVLIKGMHGLLYETAAVPIRNPGGRSIHCANGCKESISNRRSYGLIFLNLRGSNPTRPDYRIKDYYTIKITLA